MDSTDSNRPDHSNALPHPARKLRFGPFEVDLRNRELRNRGLRIKLEQKPFQILQLLLEDPGALVTRAQLARHLWPDLHVNFDRSLNTAVNTLRQVLGDSPRHCRYIETRPRVGYRFIAPVEEIESSAVPAGDSGTSIVVLPFENVPGNSETALLADGIAEGLIASLSASEHLRVIARTTAFRFRAPEQDPVMTGRFLNVQAVLAGRLEEHGASLRIAAELVESRTARRLWGKQYHCPAAGIFSVEREISAEVAKILIRPEGGRLGQFQRKGAPSSFGAYQDYLKGRYFYHKMTEEDLHRSVAYFEAALAQDPQYALAYAGLADTYGLFAFMGLLPALEAQRRAKELALAALRMDSELAEAHASLAGARKLFDWDWAGAESEYRKALQLNPNYAAAHHWYADFLSASSRPREALREIRCALKLDPLSLVINMEVAWNLYMAGDFQGALEQSWQTLALDPKFAPAQHTLGLAYEQLGMHEEAIMELQNARTCSGDHPATLAALGHAYASAGKGSEASELLRELHDSSRRSVSPYWSSILYAGLGLDALAFESLEQACREHDVWLVWLGVEPRFDCLRSDSRFEDLLREIGLGPQLAKPVTVD
jgi:TolB-like protein/tetratricopeptide (TPR) repeat protein